MKIIIGLGNPGMKYVNNRHNVGFMVIDELQNLKLKDKILKSDKFMNDSGLFVKKLKDKYPKMQFSELYVVHDDLDIPLGSFKIQFGKGPKVHNGLNDIYKKTGSSDFWHVRVGVDNKRSLPQGGRVPGREYVLSDFTGEEKTILDGVIKQICNQLGN